MRDPKTKFVSRIIIDNAVNKIERLLVVGCGSGTEAAILSRCLNTSVTGIDIVEKFDSEAAAIADLRQGDAMALEFADEAFDFVYSYHALEHIADPVAALKEIRRVLRADGKFWIGTPNRQRLIGYTGSKDATLGQKLTWNLNDWKARLSGKFRNELGAHAGFSRAELSRMLAAEFSTAYETSHAYYAAIYSRYEILLWVLRASRLSAIAYPSVYFMGAK